MKQTIIRVLEFLLSIVRKSPDEKKEISEPQPSGKHYVAIIVGHTAKSPGAWAAEPIKKPEYEVNSGIANLVCGELKVSGVECDVFYRDDIGISGAYNLVKKRFKDLAGYDCVAIELHFNAYNGKAFGTETLYHDTGSVDERMFVNMIHKKICLAFKRTGRGDRGIKTLASSGERGFSNLSQITNKPSVLLEPGFLDNPAEAKLFESIKNRYVAAIVDSCKIYFAR